MVSEKFKRRNLFLISATVFATAFVMNALGNFLVGRIFNPVITTLFSLNIAILYFILHTYINKFSKKRQKNTAVDKFL